MEPREVEKKTNTKGIIALVIFLILIVILVVFLINFLGGKTTYTTAGDTKTQKPSLYCTTKSNNVSGAFFDLSNTESAEQAIKVIFKDKKIDNIAYNSTITYGDNSLAKTGEATLNAKYGLYMQDHSAKMTDFSPNFSADNNIVKISLYANGNQLTPSLAKIFMIDTNDDNLDAYSIKVLSSLYESKGFKCEMAE